jgi:DNA-binding HxlR family transcriptional regulator
LKRLTEELFIYKSLKLQGKWKGYILFAILSNKNKFNTLKFYLGGITSRTLTTNLNELIDIKLLVKKNDKYTLTKEGAEIGVLYRKIYDIIYLMSEP